MIKKDAIIIGSGQAGNPLAVKLAESGWKTVLIEKSEAMLGGVCVNVGCTPSKTLIASAKVMHEINTAKQHGISVENMKINFSETQKRKDKIVKNSHEGVKKNLQETKNLELIIGTASFSGKKKVTVTQENGEILEFTAPKIFINAGCRPAVPKIEGLDKVKWFDSTGILALKEIPEKLIIIGSGYIGLEMGQMYSRFGSNVEIIDQSAQILDKEDRDIAENMQEILEEEGISFYLDAEIKKIESYKKGIRVSVSQKGKTRQITGSHLLVVTGRKSNADSLALEKAGIKTDEKNFIKVSPKLETNVKGIYALGDIKGGAQFTHVAYNDYVIVSDNILGENKADISNRVIPYTVFTDPQLGRAGLSEKEARKKKLNYTVVKIAGKRITRGKESAQTQGLWKAVVDKDSGRILGAAVIGTEGGEIASVIQMAMKGKILAKDLKDFMFSHPTYSESLNTLFSEL
ncbi:mercuric reductase [Chryseobacterium sp. Leaf180]|uniref:mercuric reductase n=1 Tax=Chryseobacterium sp. Leaf180 TaxID=1736289 RepID=UPI000701D883|nr:mercuric reductase [Chryseobacterium sp. Leaf180]KQR95032.1 mercuric reductase [Chryseobacterium sp. Leaf180]